jgi:hypothetical protein
VLPTRSAACSREPRGRAEAAKSDRIGRGRALVVQPLTAALGKLLQVKQRAIERRAPLRLSCARTQPAVCL